jgi:plastocyanin
MVVWRNVDRVTHRVVLNNGSLDTGDLAPGASSQPMSINTGGGPYHCSIHPSMVGTIVAAASTPVAR